jgi:cell division protein FtsW
VVSRIVSKIAGVDRSLLYATAALILIGLAVLASASAPIGFNRFGDSGFFIKRQIFQGLIPGLIAMFIGYKLPLNFWKDKAVLLLGISVILLIMVYIPGIGAELGTFARRWISIGGFTFQPSEIVKMTFLFYLAAWLASRGKDASDFSEGFLPFIGIITVIGGLIYFQPDLGTVGILLMMSFVVYFVAGARMTHLFGLGALGALFLFVAIKMAPYRAERLMTFLHPELDPQGIGYQVNQSLLAIGSGGFFGRGYGHSVQKFAYLPETIGDSIFAVMAEELGFLLTTAFLALLVFWLWRGTVVAENAKDDFAKFLGIGIVAWIGIQAMVNIGASTALLPLTGAPLPFVSYGGTSLSMVLFACGVLFRVSKE